jgi:hypothetical protein
MSTDTTSFLAKNPLMPPANASAFLAEQGYRTSPKTLAKLRCIGGGPLFMRFGRRILYDQTHLLNWAVSRTTPPLSNTSTT